MNFSHAVSIRLEWTKAGRIRIRRNYGQNKISKKIYLWGNTIQHQGNLGSRPVLS